MDIIKKIDEILMPFHQITFLELGACDGYHTNLLYNMLKVNHNVNYHAFEPNIQLLHNIDLSYPHLRGSVKFHNKAVGDKDGVAKFYISGGFGIDDGQNYYGSSSIKKPKLVVEAFKGMEFTESNTEVITLDSFCLLNDIHIIDFIWADIQGAEIDMIKGGEKSLRNTRYLYTEYCDAELYDGEVGLKEICKLLPDFELVHDFGGDALFKNKNL